MTDRPIRVCHLGKYYPPATGGIEAVVQTMARAQAALGLDVRVLCVNHAGKTDNISSGTKVGKSATVEEMDGSVRITRLGRIFSAGGLDICPGIDDALRQLNADRVDIVHLHTPNPTMMLPLALFGRRVPIVITHHSDIVKQKVRKLALYPFEQRIYRQAARILATSPAYVEGSQLLQRHRARVEAIPLGIPLDPLLNPSPEAKKMAAELAQKYPGPRWLAVGRLVYYKGLRTALHALVKVPGTLIIIGNGPLKADLQHLAHTLGVADRVIWWGHATADELVGAYHAATAFWFPSNARSEAFGLVQVEAMACACPVINTHIPGSGVPWVSPHEQTGLTVPIEDPAAFAAAAQRLVDDPDLRNRLGQNARARAQSEFDDHLMAQRTVRVYEQLLAPRPGTAPFATTTAKPINLTH